MLVKETKIVVETVTLELSKEEIDVIREIFGNIGGSPNISRRRIVNDMNDALNNSLGVFELKKDTTGSIYFNG